MFQEFQRELQHWIMEYREEKTLYKSLVNKKGETAKLLPFYLVTSIK
jgi:hypothetical protein